MGKTTYQLVQDFSHQQYPIGAPLVGKVSSGHFEQGLGSNSKSASMLLDARSSIATKIKVKTLFLYQNLSAEPTSHF